MTDGVPTLSLAAYTSGDADARTAFSSELMRGFQRYGFIILEDHNVPVPLLDDAYRLAAEFFNQDVGVKCQYARGLRGYTPFGTEHAKGRAIADLKEFWQLGRENYDPAAPDGDFAPNVWPEHPYAFELVFKRLFAALDETGRLLLEALAPHLDLPADYFDPLVKDGTSILRVLHYPPLAADVPPGAVRAAAHEDINFITILVAAKGKGLELLDRDGTWLPVITEPKNLIVDSGDMLARLTNGVIPATTHRVVNPDGPNVSRYSMPFFMHPRSDTPLDVLPSCLGEKGALFEPITAGAFLEERLREIGLKT
ncbi:Validamycin A dioxygenase [Alphaproteobacteria bacterium SO-S41]|nr:Validamycin A dioxygenase [Alphaproteobacteria bacterium SO-S41]